MASGSKAVIFAALLGNSLISVTKFVAVGITGSAAMLGLVVAFAGVMLSQLTGILIFDGIASITIGLILIGTSSVSNLSIV